MGTAEVRFSEAVEPLTDLELIEVRAADATLAAAPWVVWDDGDIGTDYSVKSRRKSRTTGEVELKTVESLWLLNGYDELSEPLVLLRNSVPGLLERLDRAEARVAELEAELERNRPPF